MSDLPAWLPVALSWTLGAIGGLIGYALARRRARADARANAELAGLLRRYEVALEVGDLPPCTRVEIDAAQLVRRIRARVDGYPDAPVIVDLTDLPRIPLAPEE